MKSIWLGQGGLLIISGRLKIVIDPYLSNSMREVDRTMKRRIPIKRKFLRVKPDMIILTNSHPDHADLKTLKKYLHKTRKGTVVLASEKAYDKLYRERIAGRYTNIMFEEGDEWTLEHILIKGVRCKTDDKTAFGVVIEDSHTEKKIYIAGNTLYNKYLVQELPKDIDVAYIPISGQYSTMNIDDAQRFAKDLGAKTVIPFHYGMFDRVNPKKFECPNKIIPKPYTVIPIDAETEETKKLPPKERLALGLDEKPTPYPKTLKEAIKAEKADEKAYQMRKQLIDALQKFVECDDPTLTDASISANAIGIAASAESNDIAIAASAESNGIVPSSEAPSDADLIDEADVENDLTPFESDAPAEALPQDDAVKEETPADPDGIGETA